MDLNNLLEVMDLHNYNKELDNDDSYAFQLESGKLDDVYATSEGDTKLW